jgi:anion transporter
MQSKQLITVLLIFLATAVSAFAPLPLETSGRIVLALALLSAICWTLEPISIELTALCLLLALPLSGVATFESAFSAFGRPAVWLVFAGMVISQLITETRLSDLLSGIIIGRLRKPVAFILELSLLGLVLAILIPSGTVRVLIILPVLIGIIDALKADKGSPLSAAIILAVVCATYYGGTGILTASVPNLVIMGVLESREAPVYWAQWAGYVLPVIGIIRVLVGAILILLIFRPTIPDLKHLKRPEKAALGGREIRALLLLFLGVAAWSTDIIHHVHPVMIGLALTILCITPGIGPLSTEHLRKVNYPILIYIGSVFALGEAIVDSGASQALAGVITSWLQLDTISMSEQLAAITYVVTPFNFLVDTAVVGGVLTPPLLDLGANVGLSPLQVGLSTAVGTGIAFMPYQGAPFMIAYSYGYVTMRQFVTTMVLICLATLVLLVPLNLLYWRWAGLY